MIYSMSYIYNQKKRKQFKVKNVGILEEIDLTTNAPLEKVPKYLDRALSIPPHQYFVILGQY